MKTDKSHALISQLHVGPVSPQDCLALWQWRNDPHTRAMSLVSEEVKYQDHCRWFESLLHDPSQYLYIAKVTDLHSSQQETKAGMVRFDVLPSEALNIDAGMDDSGKKATAIALVSINVNPQYRGKGLSVLLLKKALNIFSLNVAALPPTSMQVSYIKAVVKSSNTASIRCFTAAGFIQAADMPHAFGDLNSANKDCVFLLSLD